eukprot:scaffold4667_cov116-Isochrysis_galbana.AAC.2
MPPKGVWEGPHAILHFVNDDDVCARFRDGELNPSPAKEEGLSIIVWGAPRLTNHTLTSRNQAWGYSHSCHAAVIISS